MACPQLKEVNLRHLPPSILSVARRPTVSQPVRHTAPDGVLNYASAVLNDGLLLSSSKIPSEKVMESEFCSVGRYC